MNDFSTDELAIWEEVKNWLLYRDAGDWERFATVWHSDGCVTSPATTYAHSARLENPVDNFHTINIEET